MSTSGVGTKGIRGRRYSVGVCYVMVPDNVERSIYVLNCLRRGTVAVQMEDGDVVFDCPVGLSVLQLIEFPEEARQLGSGLVYVNEPRHNKPIIVDRFLKDDESLSYDENQFRIERTTDTGSAAISGTGKDGNVFINATGKAETGGNLYLNVGNSALTGAFIAHIKGSFQMEVQTAVLNILDTLGITTKNNVDINSTEGTINLGDTEAELEPVLKGTTTQEQLEVDRDRLEELQAVIAAWVPVANDGGAKLKADLGDWLTESMADYGGIKSEKTFTE